MLPPRFSSNEPIHITFENSDGRQQTITGGQITHHTTGNIFQVKSNNNNNNNNDNNNDNNIEYPEKELSQMRMKKEILENSKFQEKGITAKNSKF